MIMDLPGLWSIFTPSPSALAAFCSLSHPFRPAFSGVPAHGCFPQAHPQPASTLSLLQQLRMEIVPSLAEAKPIHPPVLTTTRSNLDQITGFFSSFSFLGPLILYHS